MDGKRLGSREHKVKQEVCSSDSSAIGNQGVLWETDIINGGIAQTLAWGSGFRHWVYYLQSACLGNSYPNLCNSHIKKNKSTKCLYIYMI